jgi:glycosyltransferase involved in cell wall biosynthesis
MKLTVFIPTYNGRAKVKQLLSRLQSQSDAEFSVHVLIDGSTDETETLQEIFPSCKFHSYANSGRGAIRNRAMEVCKDGIILFLDHDMLPEKELIAQHKSFHASNENAILVGNGFRNPENATADFPAYLVQSEKRWIDRHEPEFNVVKSDFVFTACNLSMPLKIFAQINGFNTKLKDGEDFEFGMRALNQGIKVYYNRNVLAWHDDWPTLEQYIRRNSEYIAGKKALVDLNPEFEKYLKVRAIEETQAPLKRIAQRILGRAALNNSWLFRLFSSRMKFVAFRSAIHQFSKA